MGSDLRGVFAASHGLFPLGAMTKGQVTLPVGVLRGMCGLRMELCS